MMQTCSVGKSVVTKRPLPYKPLGNGFAP